ncbi:MAG: hypothetical protein HZB33_14455 [Nitrospirae bacterium]|nr:hypothetical protein [Nitrospirota bacterium]
MFRKISLITAVLVLFLTWGIAFAEPLRVVVLKSSDIAPYNEAVEGFKKSCGCVISEVLHTDSEEDAEIKGKVLERRTGLIFAVGGDALSHAMKFSSLPVVYSMVPNPGLPDISPGRVSGVSMHIPPEKYLSSMLDLFPSVRRIGVVYDQKNSGPFVKEAERFAKKRGVTLVMKQVTRPGDVLSAIDSLKQRVDLLWMLPDVTVVNSETFKYMLGFSFEHGLPLFTFARKYVEMGAAAGLNVSPYDMGSQAGEMAGGMTGYLDIPGPFRVDPKNVRLMVNDKIIRKLGSAVNEEVLRGAGHVR